MPRNGRGFDAQSFEAVKQLRTGGHGIAPLQVIAPGKWHGMEIPSRRWLVPGLLLRGTVSMLNGTGGIGKSLLMQQLMTAAALGTQWLGIDLPQVRSLAIFCEDDEEELWRRQAKLNAHYGCSMLDVDDYIRMVSRVGMDNLMMEFAYRGDERGKLTEFYNQVMAEVNEFGAELVIIDTAADTFGGDEIKRPQVRAFINALRQFALTMEGGVILTQHPSNVGEATGSGISGSTAWHNTVRGRSYLMWPKTKEGEEPDEDERILKLMKSNYGKRGSKVRLRWQDGAFIAVGAEDMTGGLMDQLELADKVLRAVEHLVTTGSKIGADRSSRNNIRQMLLLNPAFEGVKPVAIEAAKDRLLKDGRLVIAELGRKGHQHAFLRPPNLRYPGERDQANEEGETE